MKNRWCLWTMLALLALVPNCGQSADQQANDDSRRLVMIVVDLTKSMPEKDFTEALGLLVAAVVPALHDGDRVMLIRLTGDSFQTHSDFWAFPVSDQYFDPRHEAAMDSLRNEIGNAIRSLVRVDDRQSDVCGALMKAGNFCSAADSSVAKFLVIVSDFDDNVRGEKGCTAPDLAGVKVYGLYASHKGKDPKVPSDVAYAEKVGRWQSWFHGAGTINTFIWDRDMSQMNRDALAESLSVDDEE